MKGPEKKSLLREQADGVATEKADHPRSPREIHIESVRAKLDELRANPNPNIADKAAIRIIELELKDMESRKN